MRRSPSINCLLRCHGGAGHAVSRCCLSLALLFTLCSPSSYGQASASGRQIWGDILTGKLDHAFQACQEWIQAGSKNVEALALLGEIESRREHTDNAIAAFKRALEVDERSLAARIGLAQAYVTSGDADSALQQAKLALEKNPQSPRAYRGVRLIVERFVESNNASKLVPFCRTWLEGSPEDGRPHCVLGYAYESMGLLEEALEAYVLASESDMGKAEAHLGVARLYEELGRLEPARDELREALAVDPRWFTARAAFAKLCLRSGRTEEALAVSREGLSVQGKSACAHALLGHVLAARAKAFSEPKAEYEKALALDPTSREAYFGLAALLQKSGKDEDAQDCWRRFLAIEQSGKTADAVRNGWVVLHTRKVAEGQDWTGGGVTWSPDGRRLAFPKRPRRTLVTLRLDEPAADAQRLATVADSCYLPCWSPDGRHIAMLEMIDGWIATVTSSDGSERPRKLVGAWGVTWSPTEEGVLFCNANRPGTSFRGLRVDGKQTDGMAGPGYVRDAQGVSWGLSHADFSPDGQRVAFCAHRWAGQQLRELLVFDVNDWDKPIQLTDHGRESVTPDFSPDGRSIAYVSDVRGGYDLWVVAADASAGPLLLAPFGDTGVREPAPDWSPDGRELAYGTSDGIMVARLGGLDRSPIGLSAKQDGPKLTVALRNRVEKPVVFDAAYELFGPNSVRIARGPVGEKGMRVGPGDVIECDVKLAVPKGAGKCIAKLTVVTTEGERAIKLVDVTIP